MNITLIGMAGAGKSYIGKALAKKYGFRFIDIDSVIEQNSGKKLKNVVSELGDRKFIKLEQKTVLALKKPEGAVISPGGSIIYSRQAMKFLLKLGPVIFLKVPFSVIEKRVPDFEERGLIRFSHTSLKSLYGERLPLYKKYSHATVSIPSGLGVKEAVCKVYMAARKKAKTLDLVCRTRVDSQR